MGNPSLTEEGRHRAAELGRRRREDGITACFTSDLKRAAECAAIAFDGSDIPVLHDWRLREADYGQLNRAPVDEVFGAVEGVTERFPDGESWQEAADRTARFLDDLSLRWSGQRICVIGHIATLWGFHERINGVPLQNNTPREIPTHRVWSSYLCDRPDPTGRAVARSVRAASHRKLLRSAVCAALPRPLLLRLCDGPPEVPVRAHVSSNTFRFTVRWVVPHNATAPREGTEQVAVVMGGFPDVDQSAACSGCNRSRERIVDSGGLRRDPTDPRLVCEFRVRIQQSSGPARRTTTTIGTPVIVCQELPSLEPPRAGNQSLPATT